MYCKRYCGANLKVLHNNMQRHKFDNIQKTLRCYHKNFRYHGDLDPNICAGLHEALCCLQNN
jgi:hypothetical protein